MALTRLKKAQKVEALAQDLAGSTSAIVGTFAKLTVKQDFALRQKVREAGGSYRVLKNKLAARASRGTGIEGALQGLKGVSSVAYTSGDPVALAKALSAWVKENAEFTFKLGIVDGKVITVEEVQSLATMPSKDEIFAKLLFLINAPAQRLATVIGATGRDLAVVVNQGVEKGKFAPGAEVALPDAAPAEAHLAEAHLAEADLAKDVEASSAGASSEAVAATGGVADVVKAAAVEEAPVAEASSPNVAPVEAAEVAAIVHAPTAAALVEGAPAAAGASEATEAVGTTELTESTELTETMGTIGAAQAPAPVEGPAAEGAEAESTPTQAEEAVSEAPAEG